MDKRSATERLVLTGVALATLGVLAVSAYGISQQIADMRTLEDKQERGRSTALDLNGEAD